MKKILFVLIVTALLALSSAPALAESLPPYVEPAPCPLDLPADLNIECGVLIAPEDYTRPDGPVVRLPYIYIDSSSSNPFPDPILFTEGGPGYTSLPQVWGLGRSVLLENRDLIIIEQRGNRYADPALGCEIDELADEDSGGTPCLDRILAQGIDITQYTTATIAEDIESLRIALGIEKWNLYGASYSTRLMQVLMDKHPEGIRSVILQAVNPLHETRYERDPEHSLRVIEKMFADCAADPSCAGGYPDLDILFYDALADLNDNPIKLEFTNPEDGNQFEVEVSGNTLIDWMVGNAFYGPSYPHYDSAYLPMLITAASKRDTVVLRNWAKRQIENDIFLTDNFSIGLYFAVNCQDDASSITLEEFQAQGEAYPDLDGYTRYLKEFQVCQQWGLPPAEQLADEPVSSEIPTLALVGSYDPVTPPQWARTVAENLENSYYVEFPSLGHNLDTNSGCAMKVKHSFLDDPWSQPDTSCMAEEPPIGFVLPGEVIVMPGYFQSWDDINFGEPEGHPVIETLAAAAIIVCLLTVVLALILGIVVLFSKKDRRQRRESFNLIAFLPASIAGGLSFAVIVLISLVSQADVSLQGVTMVFGYPAGHPYLQALGVVVYLQMLAALLLAVMTVRSWVQQRGTFLIRLVLTLATFAVFTFWPFFLRWDLMHILWQMIFGY